MSDSVFVFYDTACTLWYKQTGCYQKRDYLKLLPNLYTVLMTALQWCHGQLFLICANNKAKTIQTSSKAELWGEYRKLTANFLAVNCHDVCFTS